MGENYERPQRGKSYFSKYITDPITYCNVLRTAAHVLVRLMKKTTIAEFETLKPIAAELEKQQISLYICGPGSAFPFSDGPTKLAIRSYLNDEDLIRVLSEFGGLVALDSSSNHDYDWTVKGQVYKLDRTKTTVGYGQHATLLNRSVSINEHLKNFDFTWMAVAVDVHTGLWFDPVGGVGDVTAKVMRHCHYNISSKPAAVLKMAYDMSLLDDWHLFSVTKTICLSMANYGYIGWGMDAKELADTPLIKPLPKDAIWNGFKKGLLGPNPKRFMSVLYDIGWLRFIPVLSMLTNNESEFDTCLNLLETASKLSLDMDMDDDNRLALSLLSLLHSIGSGVDKNHIDLSWIFSDMALTGMACPANIKNKVTNLIKNQAVDTKSNVLKIMSELDLESVKLLELLYLVKGELTSPLKEVFDSCYKAGEFICIVDDAFLEELGYVASPVTSRLIAESKRAQINGLIKDRNTAIWFLTQMWEGV